MNKQGASIAATGTISSSTASLLSFASTVDYVVVSNHTGLIAYFKINDAASPTVSTTVYDFAIPVGDTTISITGIDISNISVYVAATSGVRAVGWS